MQSTSTTPNSTTDTNRNSKIHTWNRGIYTLELEILSNGVKLWRTETNSFDESVPVVRALNRDAYLVSPEDVRIQFGLIASNYGALTVNEARELSAKIEAAAKMAEEFTAIAAEWEDK